VSHKKPTRKGSLWIVLLAAAAVVWLVGQFYPPLMKALWQGTDFRNWTREAWFGVNVVGLLLLLTLRAKDRHRRPIRASSDLGQKQELTPGDNEAGRC